MTKPFHAGHAAERGLLSARLAMRGFTSNPEAVDGRQGYADAAAAGHEEVMWERLEEQDGRFLIEDTLFKYHAACYLTHAANREGADHRPLSRLPQVALAAVIGVPSDRWGEEVKAVVVAAAGADISEAEVIAACKERLGGVKAPKSVDFMADLPRTPVGKVDKKKLREPYWAGRRRRV